MVEILVCIDESTDNEQRTGRVLQKTYRWPTVPREGEYIGVGGNQYPVYEVVHNLDDTPATIQIILLWPESDFEILSQDESWTKVYWEG